jgi:8-oxo-dGTP diphosphatase
MEGFDRLDPLVVGAKGLVYLGDEIVVYRRDQAAPVHKGDLDLPRGGLQPGETPFEAFRREVHEEFGLPVTKKDIVYAVRYPSQLNPGMFGYFIVAKLPASLKHRIVFGDEGDEYMLMTPQAYLARTDAWPVFQERTADYLSALASKSPKT